MYIHYIRINQLFASTFGLFGKVDIIDLALLEYFQSQVFPRPDNRNQNTVINDNGRIYTHLDFKQTIDENPLLPIKDKAELDKHITRLVEAGFLAEPQHNVFPETLNFYTQTDLASEYAFQS